MNEVVIVSAVRTAVGGSAGRSRTSSRKTWPSSSSLRPSTGPGSSRTAVDEVIFGQTKQSADAANLARVAALKAGLPVEVPAYTVMRQCGSGLQAVNNAAQAIMAGQADIVVAGGTESMSNAPYYMRGARYGYGSGNAVLVDSNTESQPRSQPVEIYGNLTMGLTAENLAAKYGITREEQDVFALQSQERALRRHRGRALRRGDRAGRDPAEEGRADCLRHRRAPAQDELGATGQAGPGISKREDP